MNLAGLHLTETEVIQVGKRIMPVVAQQDWLRGKKIARMLGEGDVPRLYPLVYEVRHEVDAMAVCMASKTNPCRPPHTVPALEGCACGFHAMNETAAGFAQLLEEIDRQAMAVVLDVELGGTVIEGADSKRPGEALGWRAERQRILRVFIPDKCRHQVRAGTVDDGYIYAAYGCIAHPHWCEQPVVAVTTGRPVGIASTGRRAYHPACQEHLDEQAYTLTDLANLWQTEVMWHPTAKRRTE